MPESSKQDITESKAWLILAEAHDDEFSESFYLCNTLRNPEGYGCSTVAAIPEGIRNAMCYRISDHLGETDVAYPTGDGMTEAEEREGRVMACLMFAAQAADEVGAA